MFNDLLTNVRNIVLGFKPLRLLQFERQKNLKEKTPKTIKTTVPHRPVSANQEWKAIIDQGIIDQKLMNIFRYEMTP